MSPVYTSAPVQADSPSHQGIFVDVGSGLVRLKPWPISQVSDQSQRRTHAELPHLQPLPGHRRGPGLSAFGDGCPYRGESFCSP
jgi:hypothetical protein